MHDITGTIFSTGAAGNLRHTQRICVSVRYICVKLLTVHSLLAICALADKHSQKLIT